MPDCFFFFFFVSYCSDSDSLQAERNVGFSTHMDCGSFVAEQRGRSYGRLSWDWQDRLCTWIRPTHDPYAVEGSLFHLWPVPEWSFHVGYKRVLANSIMTRGKNLRGKQSFCVEVESPLRYCDKIMALACSIEPLQVHLWACGYAQREVSLIHANLPRSASSLSMTSFTTDFGCSASSMQHSVVIVNPLRVQIWAWGYAQGEASLIHANHFRLASSLSVTSFTVTNFGCSASSMRYMVVIAIPVS